MLKLLRNTLVHSWFRLSRPATLGVRIIAIDEQDRVCLVRHTYLPGWHLPGGGVERGEDCKTAAIKEAREEAGLVIATEDIALVSIHTNFANFPGDHVLVYRAQAWGIAPTSNAHEIAEHGFFALKDLPEGTTKGTRNRLNEAMGGAILATW
jgi:ADP-ribose pyrophosphatase YjhB (NUDIX family)